MLGQPNYSLVDLIAALCSTILFAPLLMPLGYVIGWFTDVFNFRSSTPPWRLLSSLALAAALAPTISYWAMWLGGWPGAWLVFGAFLLVGLLLLAGLFKHERLGLWLASFRSIGWLSYLVPLVWLGVVLFSLVDLQIGNRLYFNVSSYDHSLRTEFTHSISRTGVPPVNPLFHLGSASILRYHYFWFILCSMVERIGGGLLNGAHPDSLLNARQAMMGSIVWAGWALAATIPLYFRFFYQKVGEALQRRAAIGVLLLAVTGLDLFPTIFYYWRWHYLYPDMEWWNTQVSAWFSAVLWVPHHVISFVACLIGFLLIWQSAEKTGRPKLLVTALLAGIAFATAVGTSVFVTLIFAAFFFLWMAVCFWRGWRSHIPLLVLAGVVAVVLAAPHLVHLVGKSGGGAFLRLQVRQFAPIDRIAADHHLSRPLQYVLRLAFLPVNYALELGFFLLGGIMYWYRLRRSKKELASADVAAALLLLTSVGICTFFSSSLVNNDLGVRGFMPAQFVLLLWSADWIAHWRENNGTVSVPRLAWVRTLAKALLAVGVAGTVYAVLILRFYGVATDAGLSRSEFFPHGETGRRTYAFRQAYEQLRGMLPTSAIVQTNPAGMYNDFAFGLYALRQTASMNDTCGAEFGGDPAACTENYSFIEDIFSDHTHPTVEQVQSICRLFSINALVMRNTDRAWMDHDSWMWKLTPVIANDYVRVYRFGPTT